MTTLSNGHIDQFKVTHQALGVECVDVTQLLNQRMTRVDTKPDFDG